MQLRQLLILLLCLTLPLQGWAGAVAATEPPCPMQAAGSADGGDCCEDQGSMDGHGKLCKTGQECRAGSWLQVGLRLPLLTPLPLSPVVIVSRDSPVKPPPAGVWRPPQA
jgi:hypothetical protein